MQLCVGQLDHMAKKVGGLRQIGKQLKKIKNKATLLLVNRGARGYIAENNETILF